MKKLTVDCWFHTCSPPCAHLVVLHTTSPDFLLCCCNNYYLPLDVTASQHTSICVVMSCFHGRPGWFCDETGLRNCKTRHGGCFFAHCQGHRWASVALTDALWALVCSFLADWAFRISSTVREIMLISCSGKRISAREEKMHDPSMISPIFSLFFISTSPHILN